MALSAMLVSQITSSLVLFWSTLFVGLCPSLIGHWLRQSKRRQSIKTSSNCHPGTRDPDRNFPDISNSAPEVPAGHQRHKVFQGHGHALDDHDHMADHGHGHSHHHCDQERLLEDNQDQSDINDGRGKSGNGKQSLVWEQLLSFLMNFGGGVLLATSFLHMLPEINEMSAKSDSNGHNHGSEEHISGLIIVNETNHGSNQTNTKISAEGDHDITCFPSPQFLICCGFFLIYFVEELMHILLSHPGHAHTHEPAAIDHTIASQYYHNHHEHNHRPSLSKRRSTEYGSVSDRKSCVTKSPPDGLLGVKVSGDDGNEPMSRTLTEQDLQSDLVSENTKLIDLQSSADVIEIVDAEVVESFGSDTSVYSASILKCILLVFALSFHSIFDGIAIGLQDDVASLIQISFAILVHKLPIAFVVGLDVYSKTNAIKIVFYHMFPFSLMSPIGIMIAVGAFVIDDQIISTLTALSTGSLIYITFFEILLREKMESKLSGFLQFVSLLIGFIFMALILQFTGSHHH